MKTTNSRTKRTAAAAKTAAEKALKTASKRGFCSHDDPLGSYTGTPEDGGRPVQDADDL